jgi:protoheme IX farnesyltransferase
MALFATLFMAVYESFPRFWADQARSLPEEVPAGLPLRELLGAYYQLTKPAIVLLVVLTGLPAILIASRGQVDLVLAIAALVGTSLAAGSAAVFNQYFERERDKVMARTAKRPIPSGKVPPAHALAFAIVLGIASMGVLLGFTTPLAAWIALASLFFYGFFYTLILKDASPQNIVVGGVAGATAPLIGWAAVTGEVGLPAWIMFMIIFLWTPPHFWALAIFKLDDYVAARIPMFPVVYGVPATARWIVIYAMMLVPLTLLLVPLGAAGPIYLVSAMLLGLGFLALSGMVLLTQRKQDAVKLFAYSIMYTLALFTALTVDAVAGGPNVLAVLASR